MASARAGGPLRARWPSAFVGSSPMVRGQRGGGVLKLHFQDHFHNFRESWQVGNESIVQIDCQVIRKVVRPGKSCSCFQLGRNPARCQGRSCARCSGPSPLCSRKSHVGREFRQWADSCSSQIAFVSRARRTTAESGRRIDLAVAALERRARGGGSAASVTCMRPSGQYGQVKKLRDTKAGSAFRVQSWGGAGHPALGSSQSS